MLLLNIILLLFNCTFLTAILASIERRNKERENLLIENRNLKENIHILNMIGNLEYRKTNFKDVVDYLNARK